MIRHCWSVYAAVVTIDKVSNNVSMAEVIEQIQLPLPPGEGRAAFPFRSTLVTLWSRNELETEEHGVGRTRFLDPDGQVLGEWTHEIDLRQYGRTRNRTFMHQLAVSGPGLYEWEVAHAPMDDPEDWTVDARVPLEVRMVPAADDGEAEDEEEDNGGDAE